MDGVKGSEHDGQLKLLISRLIGGTSEDSEFSNGDVSLWRQALTHSSWSNEQRLPSAHNERLEFLGDSVLQLVVTEWLIEEFPDHREGQLSMIRHRLVNNEALAEVGRSLGVSELLILGAGEEIQGARLRPKMSANALEALFGVCYLLFGIERTSQIIRAHLVLLLNEHRSGLTPKQVFHEWVQRNHKVSPVYVVEEVDGDQGRPIHLSGLSQVFRAQAYINEQPAAIGWGRSKKRAILDAAISAAHALGLWPPVNS